MHIESILYYILELNQPVCLYILDNILELNQPVYLYILDYILELNQPVYLIYTRLYGRTEPTCISIYT